MIGFTETSYARLPAELHARINPVPVAAPAWIMLNRDLAARLGIDPEQLGSDSGLEILAGNKLAAGSAPLAMAYAGHQFGNWVPRLGDGRALLLGEVIDRDGVRLDIQLKGSGPTPFSRGGDGRSSIGPVVREYLGSEAMAALGIPSTRALAAVATGEFVQREQAEPGGILCRVARGHVRIGTFEYAAAQQRPALLQALVDHVIERHFPDLAGQPRPALALLDRVVSNTARLVADWMRVGFIHGVMNTDNLSVSGETIDFGPFGYMEAFAPDTVYSYIDRHGRYAWKRQPSIAQWNLARLAESLLPMLAATESEALEAANSAIADFGPRFERHFHAALCAKIGLSHSNEHVELAFDLLRRMADNQADMTLSFRRLAALATGEASQDGPLRELFAEPQAFDGWAEHWRRRLDAEGHEDGARQAAMNAVNPAFILRNHLAQQAVDAAIERLDFEPMRRLNEVLARPYDEQPAHAELSLPAKPEQRVTTTFCGT